jgi:hypothetical protein
LVLPPAATVLNGFFFPILLYAWLEEELLTKRAFLWRIFLSDTPEADKLTRLKLNRAKYEIEVLSELCFVEVLCGVCLWCHAISPKLDV